MLEEYQAQAQQVEDMLVQARDLLEQLTATLQENYPEEERTYRMGRAMNEINAVSGFVSEATSRLQNLEWPTTDRPRSEGA